MLGVKILLPLLAITQTKNGRAPIGYYGTSRIRDQSYIKQSIDSTNSPTISQDIETAGPTPKVSPVPISLMAEIAAKVIKEIEPRLTEPTTAPTSPLVTAPPTIVQTLPPSTLPLVTLPLATTPAYISTVKPYTAIQLPETAEPGIIQGYRCQQAYGYFSVANKCDSYVECKNNVAYSNVCPDGLHFNPKSKHPEYPCAYPIEVQCTAGQIAQTPISKGQCLNLYGYFPMRNGDCSKYIVCLNGIAKIMKCPAGLVFNTKIDDCDWPINVPSCNLDIFKGFKCPTQPNKDLIESFRFQGSCKSYVACQGGYPRLLNCNIGLRFDEATQSCVDASKVTNCAA